MTRPWGGDWVASRLHLDLLDADFSPGPAIHAMVGMALRYNPKRAHLLVSTVLGKHVPTDPRIVYGAGRLLGMAVADALTGSDPGSLDASRRALTDALADRPGAAADLLRLASAHADRLPEWPQRPVVLGYAETATGLGHAVADALQADYLHSTRRPVPGVDPVAGFEEEHSHATGHLLLPEDPSLLTGTGPLVLVDDELSTGRTICNTIDALSRISSRRHYVVASLVDLRSADDVAEMRRRAAESGVTVTVVSLARAELHVPADLPARGAAVVDSVGRPVPTAPAGGQGCVVTDIRAWPGGIRDGGRHGVGPADAEDIAAAADQCATEVAAGIMASDDGPRRVLVLGTEELMYAPLRIALSLQQKLESDTVTRTTVRYSTTTRSPVLAVDDPGYPIRTALTFGAHDHPGDGPGARYAYNVAPGTASARRFTDIVLVVDDQTDRRLLVGPGALVTQLQQAADRVHLVWIPARLPAGTPLQGPRFGSYPPADVSWLLKDLSGVTLEAPTEEREEAIQNSGAHYAESLPIEFQPSQDYQRLYDEALSRSAATVAEAVGVVTELVLAERGPSTVLASLARAGTPVGILMRRWAAHRYGLDLPHYAVSIVRGRGIDRNALAFLARRHDPASVVFVDGWTGKGAITRELSAAVTDANRALGLAAGYGFPPAMAVLADTGSCVRIFGTREDFLIPSACLNSTVSGLVSRTVLNDDLIGPRDFHGAKFYRDLAPADVSNDFLAAVEAHFPQVDKGVDARVDDHRSGRLPTEPTWQGWATVRQLSADYGIDQVNLIKPGVGETTRVLLRRVPWKVLMRPDKVDELAHVVLLAEQRGVDVELVPGLGYSCVGLIRPGYVRPAPDAVLAPAMATGQVAAR